MEGTGELTGLGGEEERNMNTLYTREKVSLTRSIRRKTQK